MDDSNSPIAVVGYDTLRDTAEVVVGADDLLTVAQLGRVQVRGPVARAGISVDEHGTAFRVGTPCAGRRIGDEHYQLARTGLPEAAAQWCASIDVRLRVQPVTGFVHPGRPHLFQFAGRDGLEDERACR